MQTEKRDFLIYLALKGKSNSGRFTGNERVAVFATKQIEGFQPVKPNLQQQSYQERIVAWKYQEDVIEFIEPLVESAFLVGNRVQTKQYFQQKYPKQITDWDKELR